MKWSGSYGCLWISLWEWGSWKTWLLERPGCPGYLPVRPWDLGVSWGTRTCVFERWSVLAAGAGCGLRGSYAQVSAAGEIGIQGQLLGRLVQPSCWRHPHWTYMYRYISQKWTFSLINQREKQVEAFGAVLAWVLCFLSVLIYAAGHLYMYICIVYIYVYACLLCVLGIKCSVSLLVAPGDMKLWQLCLR